MIGRETGAHDDNRRRKWLPLGRHSCFFLRFCREQKVISRAARHAKTAGGRADGRATCGRWKATRFLRER